VKQLERFRAVLIIVNLKFIDVLVFIRRVVHRVLEIIVGGAR